jgi:glycine/D-amino acid oxidase-like deaminating enzyme
LQAQLHSPGFVAGLNQPDAAAIINPAKLAWGLKRVCEGFGVRIFEGTPATSLDVERSVVRASTPLGSVVARRVALATYAHPSLLKPRRP